MTAIKDQWVKYRSAQNIKYIVDHLLQLCSLSGQRYFNIVHMINKNFVSNSRYSLLINYYDQKDGQPPAYISFKPLTLNVDTEIWRDALIGDPRARYILAHEVGHIVMHQYAELSFSNSGENQLKSPPNERSAEWQANVFAHFLLVPDIIVSDCKSILDISAEISVPSYVIATVKSYDSRRDLFEFITENNSVSDICNNCGNFSLTRNGPGLECHSCGNGF